MSQISRKELKNDEFVSGMDAAYEYFLQHQKSIIAAAVAVVVVVALGWGVYAWRNSRNRAATAMLAEGINTLHSPLLGPSTPKGTAAYASTVTRANAAIAEFQKVIDQYPSTEAGQLARFYLGLAQLDTKSPDAVKNLETAAASSNAVTSTAAKHALANVDIQNGKLAEAHNLLQQLTQQDSATLPRAVAVMELADLDRTYNPKEAAELYKRLQTDYPGTSTADQAQQQLASLKTN